MSRLTLILPTYGGSQLRFLSYLPGFRERGIDVRIVSGTPTVEDVTAGNSTEIWSRYPAGAILPVEIVNGGVPVMRVRLPDRGGLRRSFHYLLADFNPDALAEVLRRLLEDPGLRQRLAGVALQWIRQTMDQQASLDQYASLYKELASKQKAVAFASFDSLSRKEADGFFKSDKLKPSDASDGDSYKVRLGKLGGYRDYFSDEQNACIDSLVRDRLNPVYGYR